MSVLETVTVDNVTYDMHDPKVGSGTLSTSAQTLIPAINELKTGVDKTNIIGSGSLNTTSQTLIGAVNELKSGVDSCKGTWVTGTKSAPRSDNIGSSSNVLASISVPANSFVIFYIYSGTSSTKLGFGKQTSSRTYVLGVEGFTGSGSSGSGEYIQYADYCYGGAGLVFTLDATTINLRYAHNVSSAQTITYGYSVRQ